MKRRQGYTLLEVMVAILILVVALPALTKWVLYGRNSQVNGFREEAASILAQKAFDSLAQLTRSGRTPASGTAATYNGQNFSVTWNWLTPASPYSGATPGACTITVSWTDGTFTRSTSLTGALP